MFTVTPNRPARIALHGPTRRPIRQPLHPSIFISQKTLPTYIRTSPLFPLHLMLQRADSALTLPAGGSPSHRQEWAAFVLDCPAAGHFVRPHRCSSRPCYLAYAMISPRAATPGPRPASARATARRCVILHERAHMSPHGEPCPRVSRAGAEHLPGVVQALPRRRAPLRGPACKITSPACKITRPLALRPF